MATIPKNARYLTFGGEEWRWKTDGWAINVWSPEAVNYIFTLAGDSSCCKCCSPTDAITPGMVRKYIEENYMSKTPEFVPEEPEVGKLYVYRDVNVSQGASIRVQKIRGGTYPDTKERYNELMQHFSKRLPVFLVSYKTSIKDKVSYARILSGDLLLDIKIEYPRTFRGSFAQQDER